MATKYIEFAIPDVHTKAFKEWAKTLTKKQQDIIEMRVDRNSFGIIGRKYKITKQGVHYHLKRIAHEWELYKKMLEIRNKDK